MHGLVLIGGQLHEVAVSAHRNNDGAISMQFFGQKILKNRMDTALFAN
jgi:hypothetical protein